MKVSSNIRAAKKNSEAWSLKAFASATMITMTFPKEVMMKYWGNYHRMWMELGEVSV